MNRKPRTLTTLPAHVAIAATLLALVIGTIVPSAVLALFVDGPRESAPVVLATSCAPPACSSAR